MLLPVFEHPWDLTPTEAIALQRDLAQRAILEDRFGEINTVAGLDVGLSSGLVWGAVVVLSFPELQLIEHVVAERPLTLPYIPGLLSFREVPVLLDALAQIESAPDLLLVDGQGYAHPRRVGNATHIGILLDRPTIGCAKSRLVGSHDEPGENRGAYTWLVDREETVGAVVRTRTRVKPMYISPGHRISFSSAIDLVLRCGGGYRLPEPTRLADRLASKHRTSHVIVR